MLSIEEILKLPKAKQVEIMEAIQDNLDDDFAEDRTLSKEQLEFIQQRMQQINNSPAQTLTLNELKEKLANRWNTL
ncbi:addiction module protein [Lacibacter luteus]|nr:addiction module protein [Lacibacter luteus]